MSTASPEKGSALAARATRGVALLAVAQVAKNALSFVRVLVLARLLDAEAFGLLALGLVLTRALETVMALGPEKLLIQRKDLDDAVVGTAWTLRAGLGLVVGLAALASAPLYGWMVEDPRAPGIVAIVALSSVLRGLRSPGLALAERDLGYGRVAAVDVGVTAFEVALAAALAATVGGAEALAWGIVGGAVAEVVTSILFFRRVRPTWDPASAREILEVGGHFLVVAIGTFVMLQGDNFVVGKLLGAEALGWYVVAYRLCELPIQITQQISNRVVLTAFSKLQDEPPARKAAAFLHVFEIQLALLVGAALGALGLADAAVCALYGDEWVAAVAPLRALALVVYGRGVSNLVGPFLLANGHFAFTSRNRVLEAAALVAGALVGTLALGVVGAALGAGAGFLLAAAARFRFLVRELHVPAAGLVRVHLGAVGAALPAFGLALAIDLAPGPAALRLAAGTLAYAAAWLAATWMFRPTVVRALRAAAARLRGGKVKAAA